MIHHEDLAVSSEGRSTAIEDFMEAHMSRKREERK